MNKVKKTMQCPVTVIGEITEEKAGKVKLVDSKGKLFSIKKTGWDHFTSYRIHPHPDLPTSAALSTYGYGLQPSKVEGTKR